MALVLAVVLAAIALEGLVVAAWLSFRFFRQHEIGRALVVMVPVGCTASLLALGWTAFELHLQIRIESGQDTWYAAVVGIATCCYGVTCGGLSAWAFRRTRSLFEQYQGFVRCHSIGTLGAALLMLLGWIVLLSWGIFVTTSPIRYPRPERFFLPLPGIQTSLSAVWWLAVAVAGLAALRTSVTAKCSLRQLRLVSP
jgi:hypothetical protein